MKIKLFLIIKILLITKFFFIFSSFSALALAPESNLNIFTNSNNEKSLEKFFLKQKPLIIDLSAETIPEHYSSSRNPFSSILLINGDKKVKNFTMRQLVIEQFHTMQIFKLSRMSLQYEDLFISLAQIRERFTKYRGKMSLDLYIADVIRNFLVDKGYSFQMLRNTKNFNLEFIIFELVKNAIVHGNNFDMQKGLFIEWDVNDFGIFTIKMGDYSPSFLVENNDGLKKIINKKVINDVKREEKLQVAKNTFITGENKGVNYFQLINNKRWTLKTEIIEDTFGNEIGKFVIVQTSIRKEKKVNISLFGHFYKLFTDFVYASS